MKRIATWTLLSTFLVIFHPESPSITLSGKGFTRLSDQSKIMCRFIMNNTFNVGKFASHYRNYFQFAKNVFKFTSKDARTIQLKSSKFFLFHCFCCWLVMFWFLLFALINLGQAHIYDFSWTFSRNEFFIY